MVVNKLRKTEGYFMEHDSRAMIDNMFGFMALASPSEMESLSEGLNYPFAKNSKILSFNFTKDVFQIANPRLLSITGHLYFDHLLHKLISQEAHSLKSNHLESFKAKLVWLHDNGKIGGRIFKCLVEVNGLRNNFAHELAFDLADWDPRATPHFVEYGLKSPRSKKAKYVFNTVFLKIFFFALLLEMESDHPSLKFENFKKAPYQH